MTVNGNILFHASSIGKLMSKPKDKTETIAATTKTHLLEVYAREKYGRVKEIKSKFLDKGNICEEDSITLLSRVSKKVYFKNDSRLINDFITGEPDLSDTSEILNCNEILDTKSSFDIHTFLSAKHSKIDPDYYWQGMSYLWLTGADLFTLCYCLVNSPVQTIMDEKRSLLYKYPDDGSISYQEKHIERCKMVERNHIYDLQLFIKQNPNFDFDMNINEWNGDIPMNERVHKITVSRNDKDIELIKLKVIDCRTWMNTNLFKTELITA